MAFEASRSDEECSAVSGVLIAREHASHGHLKLP